jgi:transcriptional regulator with XRE-family HTH domain
MARKPNRLYEIRQALNLTQAELGKRLTVAKNYIYLIESGKKPLSAKILDQAEHLLSKSNLSETPEAPPDDLAAQLRAELAECREQLKQAHATIAVQARTIEAMQSEGRTPPGAPFVPPVSGAPSGGSASRRAPA